MEYECEKLKKQAEKSYRGCGYSLIGVIVLLIIELLLCASCATKVVTVPEIHYEYITKHDSIMVHDSISVHDSVVIKQMGDTIYCDRWHMMYKDRWRDRVVIDSIIKTDSIAVPYPVEKKLTKWQQLKLDCGEILIIIIVLVIFSLIIWLCLGRRGQRKL